MKNTTQIFLEQKRRRYNMDGKLRISQLGYEDDNTRANSYVAYIDLFSGYDTLRMLGAAKSHVDSLYSLRSKIHELHKQATEMDRLVEERLKELGL
jgi:hypothetical protein